MTTTAAGGKITGLLALTMIADYAADVGDAVQVSDDYTVSPVDGTSRVLGHVSVANKKRVSTAMSTTVGVANVGGDVTVEARGLYVRTVTAGGTIAAGDTVGYDASGDLVPEGVDIATCGHALMGGDEGDRIDVLFF